MRRLFFRFIDLARNRLSAASLLLTTFILIAVIAVLRPSFMVNSQQQALAASSYNDLVDGLIRDGYIVRNSAADGDIDGDAPAVILTENAANDETIAAFRDGSYLRRDLLADDDRWQMRDGRVHKINPRIHSLQNPFTLPRLWTGSVQYRHSDDEEPSGLHLISSDGFQRSLSVGPSSQRQTGLIDALTGEVRGDIAFGFEFVSDIAGEATPVASLSQIDGRPVLSARCGGGLPVNMSLISSTHPSDICSEADQRGEVTLLLSAGDAIAFSRSNSQRNSMFFTIGSDAHGLSRFDPFAGRVNNINIAAGIGAQIASAMNQRAASIYSGEGRNAAETENVELTLQSDVQSQLDSDFTQFLKEYQADLGREEPVEGAIAVIDALSGDILGIGSQAPDPRFIEAGIPRNQAFVPMAPGSTAKVPVSAAILAQYPGLRYLCAPGNWKIDGEDKFDRVLGIQLESFNTDLALGGRMPFEIFLQRSSNRYASALLLLASARTLKTDGGEYRAVPDEKGRRLPERDQYSLINGKGGNCDNARLVTARPSFLFPFVPGENGTETDQLRITRDATALLGPDNWTHQLQNLFDMDGIIPSNLSSPYDTSIWDRFVDSEEDQSFFYDVTPERENFGFGSSMSSIRANYLPVILGGGQARWTTVKLAESYGRIVSNVKANATIAVGGAHSAEDGQEFRGLNEEARLTILRGMRLVVNKGTGRELIKYGKAFNDNARDGEAFYIFAKTGTPTIRKPARSRLNGLINRLIEANVIKGLGGDRIGVQAGDEQELALERATRNSGITLSPAQSGSVLRWISRTNDRIEKGQSTQLRFVDQGKIRLDTDIWRELGDSEIDEGGVLAFVVARYCKADGGDHVDTYRQRPKAAIAIAINVAARERRGRTGNGSGANPGLAFIESKGLLGPESAIVKYLRESGREGAQCR